MYLNIHPNILIEDIQHEFNGMFPYLKLEFFRKKGLQQPNLLLQGIFASHKISEAQTSICNGELEIKPVMTVKELENNLLNDFSLLARVFRRSGNIWLQPTMTDNWTLVQQNEHGKEISLVR